MMMQSVKSSLIDVIGYDETTHRLRVCFHHAKPQNFAHVPKDIFLAFLNSRSKNRFYRRHIEGCYPE